MFFRRKKQPTLPFDPETQEPAVRKSICTGEMTAGYVDKQTGAFHELMKVDQKGLEEYRRLCGGREIKTIY